MSLKKAMIKALLIASLILFVVSVFQPWIWEHGQSPLAIHPSLHTVSQFWSFQTVVNLYLGNRFARSYTLRFQEYWFDREFGGYPNVYQGWMWVLMFQIVTVALAILSIVREKVKEHPLPLFGVISTSVVTLTLACYQLLRHSASGRGISYLTVSIDTGFVLALSSLALWLIALFVYMRGSRKTTSLEN